MNKFERLGDDVFQIISKPIEVDGRVYAFELATLIDSDQEQQRKEALLNLKEHEMRIISALTSDYEAVYHVDARNGRIETIRESEDYAERNPGLGNVTNYSEYFNLVTSNIYEEDLDEYKDVHRLENIDKRLKEKNVIFHVYRIVRNGNAEYHQLKIICPGDWKKDKEFMIGVSNLDDLMKERIANEEALDEAREEAEAANKAKTSFLFNMSHDICTPMNAIIGFNNMAIKNIDDRDKVEDCLNKVNTSSEHLLSIINDILDMARIESGKVELVEEPVDVVCAAEDLTDIVKESIKGKRITFESDFSAVRNRCIKADKLRVNRILMNIASNAVKYTPDGGSVKYVIVEKNCKTEGYAAFDFVISDTGIGMSEAFLATIFEAFTREANSTVSGIQGTGLGMAITKELVELMGGTIDITSKPGKGTTVTVGTEFEIVDEETAGDNVDGEINKDVLRGKTVLLVEDNELNMEIATDILEDLGINVIPATDGTVAVKLVDELVKKGRAFYPDLILMDVQMPIMNGYEATAKRRVIKPVFYVF